MCAPPNRSTTGRGHTSPAKQYAKHIPLSDLKVGDLLFYTNTIESTSYITHVSFWAGNDTRFVAAYRVLGVATVDNG